MDTIYAIGDVMRISIVMTYHNRMRQLYATLRSLVCSKFKDFEIIIVDDASPIPPTLIVAQFFMLDIHVITIKAEAKWWINPCIPYNIGFKEACGDIIVIQNPECFHFGGDLLHYVNTHLKQNEYVSFPCYSTTKEQYIKTFIPTPTWSDDVLMENVSEGIVPLRRDQWYNHPSIHPKGYHFCSAIHQKDLINIGGGFNEDFANGYCFDDNEFITRIKNSYMKISMPPTSYGFVIHQWHPKNLLYCGGCPEWHKNLNKFNKLKILKGWK